MTEKDELKVWQDFSQGYFFEVREQSGKQKLFYRGLEVKIIRAVRAVGEGDNVTFSRVPVELMSQIPQGCVGYDLYLQDHTKIERGSKLFVNKDHCKRGYEGWLDADSRWTGNDSDCDHD